MTDYDKENCKKFLNNLIGNNEAIKGKPEYRLIINAIDDYTYETVEVGGVNYRLMGNCKNYT